MSERYQLRQSKIIVAIPAYNEGQFIAEVVLKARRFADKVVVVDDGSTDHTAEVAEKAGASIVTHKLRRGYGEAIKSCFEAAKAEGADVLVTLDGDNQHDALEIPKLVASILRDKADLVVGSRFLGEQTNMARYRKCGIRLITWLLNLGSGIRVSDAQSGFRAYGEKALHTLSITEQGFGISVELLVQAKQVGCTISEVPISCTYHSASHTANPLIHGLGVALVVLKLRFKSFFYRRIMGSST